MGSITPALPRRHFLFTYPRTASHLMMRILDLEHQDAIAAHPPEADDYFFMAMLGIVDEVANLQAKHAPVTEESRARFKMMLQSCATKMENFIQQGEAEGKCIFIKEHVQLIAKPDVHPSSQDPYVLEPWWTTELCGNLPGNESELNQTVLPREFLLTLTPTFLIRHPALTFTSLYRALQASGRVEGKEQSVEMSMGLLMSMQPVRKLYEWFNMASLGQHDPMRQEQLKPIILDANDMIHDPDLLVKYGQMTNLDIAGLATKWDVYDDAEREKIQGRSQEAFLSTIAASTGLMKSKAPPTEHIDIDVEAKKWCAEFGDNVGMMIKRLVETNLPDYLYLWSQRFMG